MKSGLMSDRKVTDSESQLSIELHYTDVTLSGDTWRDKTVFSAGREPREEAGALSRDPDSFSLFAARDHGDVVTVHTITLTAML